MDPAQLKNRTALQGVLAMLKGAKSPAQVAKVVSIAFSTESLYTFSELRHEPAVEALAETEQKPWLDVLQIYQYGTYRDYVKKAEQFKSSGIELDRKQQDKLRISSFIVLGSQPPITFDSAMSALSITADQEADRVLQMSRYFMLAVDDGLVNGRIDSQARKIYIDAIAPLRDVATSEHQAMLNTITLWMAKTDKHLKNIEDRSRKIRLDAETRRTDEEEFERRRDAADLEASKGRKRGGGAGADGADDETAGSNASGTRNTRAR